MNRDGLYGGAPSSVAHSGAPTGGKRQQSASAPYFPETVDVKSVTHLYIPVVHRFKSL
jgi:hypothetical protein